MSKLRSLPGLAVGALLLFSTVAVLAQNNLSSWPYFVEVNPGPGSQGLYDVVVPFAVFDKSRQDLADLRLFDANGREVPYAVRVLRAVNERRAMDANTFNQATIGNSREVTLDLGDAGVEHNEVEVSTTGSNSRRRVDIEGSDSGKEWRTLKNEAFIFGFNANNSSVESNRVSYPSSRYRYLRVKVFSDEITDDHPPEITEVKVLLTAHENEQLSTWSVSVPATQYLRNRGAAASSWNIDLGSRVPCDRLELMVGDNSFSRHFELENVDDPQNIHQVTQGELVRRSDEEPKPLVINFDKEEYVRNLRLVINDYSNQTLMLTSINASAPARQLIFELKEPAAQPLRLFFGNQKIEAPQYDFEKDLAAKLTSQPTRVTLGPATTNQSFIPEPLPLTERVPWLIYLVLAASSVALGLILWSLARKTLQKQPATTQQGASSHN